MNTIETWKYAGYLTGINGQGFYPTLNNEPEEVQQGKQERDALSKKWDTFVKLND